LNYVCFGIQRFAAFFCIYYIANAATAGMIM